MSKAEELAEKAYPVGDTKLSDAAPSMCRNALIEGYHQAEKDLELTWDDIETIQEMANKYCKHHSCEPRFFVYKEVLKQFKEMKEK